MKKSYKEIVVLNKITHNGKEYRDGDIIRNNVKLSDSEVKQLNDNPNLTGCRYDEQASGNAEEKYLSQMNKSELHDICEAGGWDADEWDDLTKKQLIEYIEGKQ